MRLRPRLVLLILATMLPLLGYSAITQFIRYRNAEQRAAVGEADSVARAVQQSVNARLVALRVLALSPELQRGDFVAFRRTAEVLIANELPGANVLLLARDGSQLVNTAAPPGTPLPPRNYLDSLTRVFDTGQPVLSDLFTGVLLQRPVVAIEVPVKAPDGSVLYDLALNPTPNAFLDSLGGDRALDAVVTVFDRQGVTVARSRDHNAFVGAKADEPLLSHLMRGEESMLRVETPEGSDSVVALSRIEPFGWTVSVELPGTRLSASALQLILPTLAVGGVMILLSVALAAFASHRIAGPIDALRNMGEEPGRADWGQLRRLPEVHDVALALRDTRQRVRARTADLEKTIEERDLLLREVYHRVKNNLQMVDSMLAMQARRIVDPAVRESLTQLRSRVHALSVVHAQLMAATNLRTFEVGGFLKELASNLADTLSSTDRPVRITVESDVASVTLDIAIPLGLALTELLTNSAKHASTADGCTIHVRFDLLPERQALLTVQDDGGDPSAPDRFAAGVDGLGARLVQGFVRQIDGAMTVEYAHGMRVEIRLPLPEDT